jgi:hypothetical protein
MYRFHVTVHTRPASATVGSTVKLGGREITTLSVPHEALAEPFSITFEDAADRLGQLDRLFIEPDGSFVWASPQAGPPWQVDGNLFDRNGRLLFVDLKGSCPPAEFDRLLSALGWPATPVMLQLVREAVLLDENAFRRWAEAEPRATA